MSSKDMTLTQLKHTPKSFDDTHTVKVKDLKTGGGGTKHPRNTKPPKWFSDFADQVLTRLDRIEKFEEYVLDVFKRNNLK